MSQSSICDPNSSGLYQSSNFIPSGLSQQTIPPEYIPTQGTFDDHLQKFQSSPTQPSRALSFSQELETSFDYPSQPSQEYQATGIIMSGSPNYQGNFSDTYGLDKDHFHSAQDRVSQSNVLETLDTVYRRDPSSISDMHLALHLQEAQMPEEESCLIPGNNNHIHPAAQSAHACYQLNRGYTYGGFNAISPSNRDTLRLSHDIARRQSAQSTEGREGSATQARSRTFSDQALTKEQIVETAQYHHQSQSMRSHQTGFKMSHSEYGTIPWVEMPFEDNGPQLSNDWNLHQVGHDTYTSHGYKRKDAHHQDGANQYAIRAHEAMTHLDHNVGDYTSALATGKNLDQSRLMAEQNMPNCNDGHSMTPINHENIRVLAPDFSLQVNQEGPCQNRIVAAKTPQAPANLPGPAPDNGDLPDYSQAQLSFDNRRAAKTAFKERVAHIGLMWVPPQDDPTLPNTDEERKAVVRKLFGAMTDRTRFKDKPGNVLKSRWLPGGRKHYNDRDMEKVCWDIANFAERLHREGPKLLPCQDVEYLKVVKRTSKYRYADRIHVLCILLSEYKSRCDGLMKGGVLEQYVAAPQDALHSARGNSKQNEKRQGTIVAGREAKKAANTVAIARPPALGVDQNLKSPCGDVGMNFMDNGDIKYAREKGKGHNVADSTGAPHTPTAARFSAQTQAPGPSQLLMPILNHDLDHTDQSSRQVDMYSRKRRHSEVALSNGNSTTGGNPDGPRKKVQVRRFAKK